MGLVLGNLAMTNLASLKAYDHQFALASTYRIFILVDFGLPCWTWCLAVWTNSKPSKPKGHQFSSAAPALKRIFLI
jgi:hypothetical protein